VNPDEQGKESVCQVEIVRELEDLPVEEDSYSKLIYYACTVQLRRPLENRSITNAYHANIQFSRDAANNRKCKRNYHLITLPMSIRKQ
jgi:hypothetical protein